MTTVFAQARPCGRRIAVSIRKTPSAMRARTLDAPSLVLVLAESSRRRAAITERIQLPSFEHVERRQSLLHCNRRRGVDERAAAAFPSSMPGLHRSNFHADFFPIPKREISPTDQQPLCQPSDGRFPCPDALPHSTHFQRCERSAPDRIRSENCKAPGARPGPVVPRLAARVVAGHQPRTHDH